MDKALENRTQQARRAIAVNAIQRKEINSSALAFVDNRPELADQLSVAETINNSPQATQTAQLQAMVNCSAHQIKQNRTADLFTGAAQRQAKGEEEVQLKGEPVQRQENRTGMPDNLKSGIENLSGMSMDHVKVHYNSAKPAQLNAHAYAQGSDIHVATGQEKHLPHEAWHVVQQAQGRVKPTMQMAGAQVNDDAALESEADVMGGKAQVLQQKVDVTSSRGNKPLLQLKQIHDVGAYSGLGLNDTGDTFSVLDGEVAKMDATLYGAKVEPEPVDNKTQAIGAIAATAGVLGGKIKNAVAVPGYTTRAEDMNKPEVNTIDPFAHGHVQQFGDDGYLCLIYQQTRGFDGYVNGIEEGVVDKLGTFGKRFQKSMKNGKRSAVLGSGGAAADGNYSNQHDQTVNQSLINIALADTDGKADAITKLAGEGARFMWVRNNISTMTDNTRFVIGATDHGTAYITFKNLWCTWKDWFGGDYNISEDVQRQKLLARAEKNHIKAGGVVRIEHEPL